MLVAPGVALAQPSRSCRLPYALYMAATSALDLVAFRDVCGNATPEMRGAADAMSEAVIGHAVRILGAQAEAALREEFARFVTARQRTYRDPVRGDLQAICAADVMATMPPAELVARIETTRAEIATLTAPGGPLALPECTPP